MTETLSTSVLNTDAVPAPARRGAYMRAINQALATTFLAEPFYADLRSCFLGALHVIQLRASARRSERTASQIARDRHDGISVQLAVAGTSRGDAAGRAVVSTPGTIMLLDFAQPFHMVDEEERDVINVAIPRGMLQPHVHDLRALHGRVLDVETSALLAAQLIALVPRLERTPVDAAPLLGDMLLQLLLLALGRTVDLGRSVRADRRAALLARAQRIIDDRLGSADLTPDTVFEKLGISRSDLYSLFEDHGGVVRYIWRRRLEAARTALLDPEEARRIGEIAFHYGFSSEAHFARAFRAAFGKTASETRRTRS